MKTISFCIFLGCFACSSFLFAQTPKSSTDRYKSDRFGFSIQVPKGWVKTENRFASLPLSFSDKSGASIDVVLEEKIGNITPEAYLKKSVNTIKEETEGFKLVKDGKTNIGNLPTSWMTHLDKESASKSLEYYFVFNGNGYVVACTAPEKSFASYETLFKTIAQSFKKEAISK